MRSPAIIARSAKHRLLVEAPAAADRSLDRFRRGPRCVLITPEFGMRLGNFLYLWMQAHGRSDPAGTVRVLGASAMQPWLDVFPALSELTLPRGELRFADRRDRDHSHLYQRFGVDFTPELLRDFVDTFLRPYVTARQGDDLVINVRRGDYYADDAFAAKFGFDQLGYLAVALDFVSTATQVLVVSDDPTWCHVHLGPLLEHRGLIADYAAADPVENFLAVAGARRIIGTNSTFTYWAAYVADVLHDDAEIVMPSFHARTPKGADAYQLDPRWRTIDGFH